MNLEIREYLGSTLDSTDFTWLGDFYHGKVRDCYSREGKRIIVTSDRLSCFDKVITTIPFKGQVLTRLALYWFDLSRQIIQNHVISSPDPNVMIVSECSIVPIEVVVRGYLAGSGLRDYKAGKTVSGVTIPAGIKDYGKLENPILTPSTKESSGGHDTPISESEILKRAIISESLWNEIKTAALKLFELGSRKAAERGLILADTKYEFGTINGKLVLADEIHTLDSSRYWRAATYKELTEQGKTPEMLDKEPVRQWLLSRGWSGEGPAPAIPDEYRIEIAEHYINAFEAITGEKFIPDLSDPKERIAKLLRL